MARPQYGPLGLDGFRHEFGVHDVQVGCAPGGRFVGGQTTPGERLGEGDLFDADDVGHHLFPRRGFDVHLNSLLRVQTCTVQGVADRRERNGVWRSAVQSEPKKPLYQGICCPVESALRRYLYLWG